MVYWLWRDADEESESEEEDSEEEDSEEEDSEEEDSDEEDGDEEVGDEAGDEIEDSERDALDEAEDDETEEELKVLKVEELKNRLRNRGLKLGGRKAELIDRLMGREQRDDVITDINVGGETAEYLSGLTVEVLKVRLRKKGMKLGGKKSELIDRLMGRGKPEVKEWKKSDARRLLVKLFKDKKSRVHRMTDEGIHESVPLFEAYPLPKFKEYLKGVRETAAELREIIAMNEREIWEEELAFPRGEKTCRGYPFWRTHSARPLLEKDIKSGKAADMKPKILWGSRKEYMEFPPDVFRGHIYQEKRRQREGPGYVAKRNKEAQKMHDEEVNAMKEEWDLKQQDRQEIELQKLCENWELFRVDDSSRA
jgi:hypothetical protein